MRPLHVVLAVLGWPAGHVAAQSTHDSFTYFTDAHHQSLLPGGQYAALIGALEQDPVGNGNAPLLVGTAGDLPDAFQNPFVEGTLLVPASAAPILDPGVPQGVVPAVGQANGAPVTVTPEPATMAIVGTGLVGLFAAARRRRKNLPKVTAW